MIEVPSQFKQPTFSVYPPGNTINYEEWFYHWYVSNNIKTDREYLPIMWHTYYMGENFGRSDTKGLQTYLRSLDRKLRYFTICQFDGAIIQDISFLDIVVFNSCGSMDKYKDLPEVNRGYPISLVCNMGYKPTKQKDVLCSFIGAIDGRHPIRERIRNIWQYDKQFYIKPSTTYNEFVDVMSRSWFSLAPRGVGWQSYRICESLYFGSIPIYISDHKWLPWPDELNFEDIGIVLDEKDIPNIKTIIQQKSITEIETYLKNGQEAYEQFFTFIGQSKKIIQRLK